MDYRTKEEIERDIRQKSLELGELQNELNKIPFTDVLEGILSIFNSFGGKDIFMPHFDGYRESFTLGGFSIFRPSLDKDGKIKYQFSTEKNTLNKLIIFGFKLVIGSRYESYKTDKLKSLLEEQWEEFSSDKSKFYHTPISMDIGGIKGVQGFPVRFKKTSLSEVTKFMDMGFEVEDRALEYQFNFSNFTKPEQVLNQWKYLANDMKISWRSIDKDIFDAYITEYKKQITGSAALTLKVAERLGFSLDENKDLKVLSKVIK